MTLLFRTLFFCTAVLAVMASTQDPFLRLESYPHALRRPFLDKYLSSRFYDYGGSTLIKSDSFIRLTGDRPSEAGWLFSRLPALPENFQVEFDFNIHGGKSSSLFGDGMAFWVTTHKGEQGPVFGSSDKFTGLGIFFDTYKNNRPGKTFPYIMAMLGDGQTSYDGDHDGLANEVGACSGRGLHNSNDLAKARVTYVRDGFLSLDMDFRGQNKWKNCFVIENADLPKTAFMGFSAKTGELTENHDIHRVQVFSLRNPPRNYDELIRGDSGISPANTGDQNPYSLDAETFTKKSGSWSWFFFKCLMFLSVIGAAVGYFYNSKKKRSSSKDSYLL